jgi:hypothetical protein
MTVFSAIILLLTGAAGLYYEIGKRRACSVPATAVVAEIKKDSSRAGRAVFIPILEYKSKGKTVRGNAGIVRKKEANRYQTGKSIEILYNPDKPEEFRIAGKNGVLILSIVLLALGAGGLLTEAWLAFGQ